MKARGERKNTQRLAPALAEEPNGLGETRLLIKRRNDERLLVLRHCRPDLLRPSHSRRIFGEYKTISSHYMETELLCMQVNHCGCCAIEQCAQLRRKST